MSSKPFFFCPTCLLSFILVDCNSLDKINYVDKNKMNSEDIMHKKDRIVEETREHMQQRTPQDLLKGQGEGWKKPESEKQQL
jgi:hypothetical protein